MSRRHSSLSTSLPSGYPRTMSKALHTTVLPSCRYLEGISHTKATKSRIN
jgi:hypothetical protein